MGPGTRPRGRPPKVASEPEPKKPKTGRKKAGQ
jgi:hypothetical protein